MCHSNTVITCHNKIPLLFLNVDEFAKSCKRPPETFKSSIYLNYSIKNEALCQGCQMVYFQTKMDRFWRALHRLENVDIYYGH
jgi:hypothetical protein